MSYKAHIGSRLWNEIRQRILARCKGHCESCGKVKPIQIHHLNYERVGYERDSDLAALCGLCHAAQHGKPSNSFSETNERREGRP